MAVADPIFDKLEAQIEARQAAEDHRSYLDAAINAAWSGLSGNSSADELKAYQSDAQKRLAQGQVSRAELEKEITARLNVDQKDLSTRSEIDHYGGGLVKTATLFLGGRLGLAGTIATYALDQARPSTSLKEQFADLTLGGAKGGLMKGVFHVMGKQDVGIAAKGVGLGVSSRVLDLGLTRETYRDNSGNASISTGLANVIQGSLNEKALLADVAVFGLAHGAFKGLDRFSGDAIGKSKLLSTVFTGTTFGLSSGTTREIMRQQAAGQGYDLGAILKRGLLQGAIDSVAAAPGGVQAGAASRLRPTETPGTHHNPLRIEGARVKSDLLPLSDVTGAGNIANTGSRATRFEAPAKVPPRERTVADDVLTRFPGETGKLLVSKTEGDAAVAAELLKTTADPLVGQAYEVLFARLANSGATKSDIPALTAAMGRGATAEALSLLSRMNLPEASGPSNAEIVKVITESRRISELSTGEFSTWSKDLHRIISSRPEGEASVDYGAMLSGPQLSALPPQVLHQFLTTGAHARSRFATDGRVQEGTITDSIHLALDITAKFPGEPALSAALLQTGKGQKMLLEEVLHHRTFDKDVVRLIVEGAGSLSTVKAALDALKASDALRAMEAIESVRPDIATANPALGNARIKPELWDNALAAVRRAIPFRSQSPTTYLTPTD
jgi:hypothetical protein